MPERRAMRREEREPVLDLLELAFGGERDVFTRYMDEDPAFDYADYLLALEDERPIACVQIFTKLIRLRGETVALGGIGSVATHPEHRHHGLASELLRDAIKEMNRRGMVISLLFSGAHDLYEQLGWVQIPSALLAIRRPAEAPAAPEAHGLTLRPFRDADLPQVRALYDTYSASLEASTVRDGRYWRGQLRYAGIPDEDFRVAERNGEIVAYARVAKPRSLMEFARAAGAADALCALALASIPERGPLIAPPGIKRELESLLRDAGAQVDGIENTSMMWRVLNANKLTRLAGPSWGDAPTLLEALLAREDVTYWPSDRF